MSEVFRLDKEIAEALVVWFQGRYLSARICMSDGVERIEARTLGDNPIIHRWDTVSFQSLPKHDVLKLANKLLCEASGTHSRKARVKAYKRAKRLAQANERG
jgi:hypothetical protein